MLFNEEFLEKVQKEPVHSVVESINICFGNIEGTSVFSNWKQSEYENLIETYSLILSIFESFDLHTDCLTIEFKGERTPDCVAMKTFLDCIHSEYSAKSASLQLDFMKKKFKKGLNQTFTYEFSQGDLDRVQILITELRQQITDSKLFEEKHKERLLKRLEALQFEMHKKMSDVDKFWGLIGDAGVALGKFGKDAKPFVDRIREITNIVWRTQSRAEELPSGTEPPFIEHEDE